MRVPHGEYIIRYNISYSIDIVVSKRVDGTRFNNRLVCDLKKDLDSYSFLGWHFW